MKSTIIMLLCINSCLNTVYVATCIQGILIQHFNYCSLSVVAKIASIAFKLTE